MLKEEFIKPNTHTKTMTIPDWASQDYETAQDFLADNEELAQRETLLDLEGKLTLILPTRLPACAVSFAGAFMILPLILFMIILVVFPIFGFVSQGAVTPTTLGITAGCALFFWGFTQALKLLTLNRDLFPRNYFVTLGEKGIAMHFSRWHFPLRQPRYAISWAKVQSVKKTPLLFIPALLIGKLFTKGLEILSTDGQNILIPLHPLRKDTDIVLNQIETLVREKMKRR